MYENNIETLSILKVNDVLNIFKGATIVELILEPGITVLQMAMNAKCFLSNSNINVYYLQISTLNDLFYFIDDAQRIISAGGFYINHQKITNINEIMTLSLHILPNKISLVRVG